MRRSGRTACVIRRRPDAASGGGLVEVGQVLGHRRPHTTAVYAKVDLPRCPNSPSRGRGAVMTGLTDRVEEYVALRRALGFKLDRHGRLLADFANFSEAGEDHITIDAAVAWARLPVEASPIWLPSALGSCGSSPAGCTPSTREPGATDRTVGRSIPPPRSLPLLTGGSGVAAGCRPFRAAPAASGDV